MERRSGGILQRLVEQFAAHERLAGAVIYDVHGRPLAVTSGLAAVLAANSALHPAQLDGGPGEFFQFDGRAVHGVTLPIFADAALAGRLAVYHDADYIDAQQAALWRRALAGVFVQTALIVCVTLLILRWSLKGPLTLLAKWLAELRRGSVSAGPDLPEEEAFQPVKQEAARLATSSHRRARRRGGRGAPARLRRVPVDH